MNQQQTTRPHAAALEDLRAFLTTFAEIPEHEWEHCAARVELRTFAKGESLVRQGELVDAVGYLTAGLMHIVCSEAGRDVTLGFDCERRFVGAYDAMLTRTPARYSIRALEHSVVLRLSRELLDELDERHRCWQELVRRVTEHELLRKTDKELRARTRTPDERYAQLLRANSFLVRRVPQYLLAAYLGVAPETLSRIRARMP